MNLLNSDDVPVDRFDWTCGSALLALAGSFSLRRSGVDEVDAVGGGGGGAGFLGATGGGVGWTGLRSISDADDRVEVEDADEIDGRAAAAAAAETPLLAERPGDSPLPPPPNNATSSSSPTFLKLEEAEARKLALFLPLNMPFPPSFDTSMSPKILPECELAPFVIRLAFNRGEPDAALEVSKSDEGELGRLFRAESGSVGVARPLDRPVAELPKRGSSDAIEVDDAFSGSVFRQVKIAKKKRVQSNE